MAGDETTGVTVIRMDEGLDTGPIVRQREEPILAEDDAGSLGARLAAIGATELVSVLRTLAGGDMTAHPQDDAGVTVAPRIGPDERVIDWRAEAPPIVRLVRGLAPEPGATTAFRDQPLKVLGRRGRRRRVRRGSGHDRRRGGGRRARRGRHRIAFGF